MRIAILVNAQAAHNKALKNWKRFKHLRADLMACADIFVVNSFEDLEVSRLWILDHVLKGTRKFIAAGGDGTLNVALNLLVASCAQAKIPLYEITLGAVGLGSSNDFHKPFNKKYAHLPCRIDFKNAFLQDIFYCSLNKKTNFRKFFLINASIGITAQANYLFNTPPVWLVILKCININLAIVSTALRTLFLYKNISVDISIDNKNTESYAITNVGIIKNRYFSGFFCYDKGAEYEDGYFMLHLSKNMTLRESLYTLRHLAQGLFTGLPKTQSILARTIYIKSTDSFCIELDGEVIQDQQCEMGIHHERIRLCS